MAQSDQRKNGGHEVSERDAPAADRRQFLKASLGGGAVLGAAGAGCAAPQTASGPSAPTTSASASAATRNYRPPEGFAAPALANVRVAFVGVGLQGGGHVKNFLHIPGIEIKALCDIDAARAAEVQSWVTQAGRAAPTLYTAGPKDYLRLCERADIDLVYNATPWEWHVPICVAAMQAGKHVAVEVPAAYTIDGTWQLVETAESTRRHCSMLENCCYDRPELMVLNMVRQGVFGELIHGEGGYLHDLRAIKFSDKNEGLWRLAHSTRRNGNLYPTHGLGPIAQCMDITRGDQFDYLVSVSSNARGLELYARTHLQPGDPRLKQRYVLGDMNTSLIKTKRGRSIMLQHDTTSPRPYSRIHLLQGTRGIFRGYPDGIYLEGRSPDETFEPAENYRALYEHPLWKRLSAAAEGAGHGGMDYIEDARLIECLRAGTPLDMDVYDGAALSVITEVSERSVAARGRPIDIPDFTRGNWVQNRPLGIIA